MKVDVFKHFTMSRLPTEQSYSIYGSSHHDRDNHVQAPPLPPKNGLIKLIRRKLLGVGEPYVPSVPSVPSVPPPLLPPPYQPQHPSAGHNSSQSHPPATWTTLESKPTPPPKPSSNGHVQSKQRTSGQLSSSATLPSRGSAGRRPNVSFSATDQLSPKPLANKSSILKSPIKLHLPGRITVIREEVEAEVPGQHRSMATTHRSNEVSDISEQAESTTGAPSQTRSIIDRSFGLSSNYSSSDAEDTNRRTSRRSSFDRAPSVPSPKLVPLQHEVPKNNNDSYPIYSEPVTVQPTTIGSRLRLDYYESQGGSYKAPSDNDDSGIMSEADTTSTGFRRGNRARASLPIVRTPSKTLERPLGLVFLQFREETKRAVLPNEITTLDTVKALFVRAFPKVLTMQYLDNSQPRRIYVLDPRRDMFYELENLRDIRDRSVLKILEADHPSDQAPRYPNHAFQLPVSSAAFRLGQLVDDISYFSEPEFDISVFDKQPYQNLSVTTAHHGTRSVAHRNSSSMIPSTTYTRPGSSLQYSPNVPVVPPKPQRTSLYPGSSQAPTSAYMYNSEEPIYANSSTGAAHDPKPSQRPPSRSGTTTPIIDEEARYRVDAMERHLANLTGLVQKALTGNNATQPNFSPRRSSTDYANVYVPSSSASSRRPSSSSTLQNNLVYKDSNAPTNLSVPSANGPQPVHLLNNSSQNAQNKANDVVNVRYPDTMLMEYLINLQKKIRDMREETRVLRRHHQSQALTMREVIKDNFERLKAQLGLVGPPSESPRNKAANEKNAFQQEAARLSQQVIHLETAVEELLQSAVNQKSPVSLRSVERHTSNHSELSNQLADMRLHLPSLQEKIKTVMAADMEMIIKDEIFIKEEPEKLEEMAKRCKKLTGTLLNLNKLVSVQDYVWAKELPEVSVDSFPIKSSTQDPSSTFQDGPAPPARKESLTLASSTSGVTPLPGIKRTERDRKAHDMLDDLLSELEVFTDVSSRDTTPDRDGSTIKRSPKREGRDRRDVRDRHEVNRSDMFVDAATGTSLSPPSITPSNSSQSTGTTLSSMTDTSSIFSGSDSGTTISKVQVGVDGGRKTTISPVPFYNRSGFSTPVRKPSSSSETDRNLADWLNSINAPPPPLRSTSKSPLISPLSKTGFFTLPNYHSSARSTVSEPGDYQGGAYTEYANLRELRSPLKDQRLTPTQQDKIGQYYTSKLRKGSDPGTTGSPIDDLARDILFYDASNKSSPYSPSRVDAAFLSRMDNCEPPVLPPKPGNEDPTVPPPLPPRTRQEALEERHQELLRKQKQLQEQYARLQQLQREQKVRPSSPVSKSSLSPQSGTSNDSRRQPYTKMNGTDIYATPSPRPSHQMSITNGTSDSKKIYETDIL